MAARFSRGDASNPPGVRNTQANPVGTSRGTGRGKAGGMPGYIKTGQDKSAGGLKGKATVAPNRGGSIPKRAGASHAMNASVARGSMDKSYHATSTGRAGAIRRSSGTMESLIGKSRR